MLSRQERIRLNDQELPSRGTSVRGVFEDKQAHWVMNLPALTDGVSGV